MEAEILEKMNAGMIKIFMEMLILLQLRSGPMSGNDLITFIHKKFHILVSSDTVYSTLHYMEKDGLIEGKGAQRKRVYVLTDKGKETVRVVMNLKAKILGLIINLFIS